MINDIVYKGRHYRRSERTEKKYPYETVRYKCPECNAEASQTWTKEMNELWLKSIEGTFCPDCEVTRRIGGRNRVYTKVIK